MAVQKVQVREDLLSLKIIQQGVDLFVRARKGAVEGTTLNVAGGRGWGWAGRRRKGKRGGTKNKDRGCVSFYNNRKPFCYRAIDRQRTPGKHHASHRPAQSRQKKRAQCSFAQFLFLFWVLIIPKARAPIDNWCLFVHLARGAVL